MCLYRYECYLSSLELGLRVRVRRLGRPMALFARDAFFFLVWRVEISEELSLSDIQILPSQII